MHTRKITTCIALAICLLAACQKEKSDDEPAAKAKLLGKWQLIRQIDETWQPVNVLVTTQDNPVGAGDSIIFTSTEIHGYYDSPTGAEKEVYPLIFLNDSTLMIDEEPYVIRTLTNTELYLHQEDIDLPNDRKDVLKNLLSR